MTMLMCCKHVKMVNRSRAVYKLIEIQQKDKVLKPGMFVLDLGAAPGGWSEYVSQFAAGQGAINCC